MHDMGVYILRLVAYEVAWAEGRTMVCYFALRVALDRANASLIYTWVKVILPLFLDDRSGAWANGDSVTDACRSESCIVMLMSLARLFAFNAIGYRCWALMVVVASASIRLLYQPVGTWW